MFHTTKFSTVKCTTGERVQTVEALADSGASASLISWDLAKKLNMVVFENVKCNTERRRPQTYGCQWGG